MTTKSDKQAVEEEAPVASVAKAKRGNVSDDVKSVMRSAAMMNDPNVDSVLNQLAEALGVEGKYSTVYNRTVWDFEGEVAD
jgi:hypothetical protein